ncbi:hypothetical protein SAMN04488061_0287 [Filomicrobium insigne]|uniref:DUF4169 family protein n=1 Tax=Filomicrobium insigne TaxID=418854 RepID=A0A1H0GVL5_9HYPH|nr:hypothetical protein SAMN04488061_0287 [Filomicrobium insigne]
MAGDETNRASRKDGRNQRLEAQLRDNLRKRKELARARKGAGAKAVDPSLDTPEARREES